MRRRFGVAQHVVVRQRQKSGREHVDREDGLHHRMSHGWQVRRNGRYIVSLIDYTGDPGPPAKTEIPSLGSSEPGVDSP